MKTYHCLLILINVIYLTNGEEPWTHPGVGKSISNQNIKELEKIAKVTQNTDTNGTRVGTSQTRIAKSYVKLNSRMGRNEDIQSDKAKDESEVNNFVSDEEEKTNRNNNTQTVKEKEKEASTYNFYPSRRDATGKRKQAAKISLPPKPALPETTPKPTKYHYYPHNQHIYLLPECAIQQVCNAVYVRLNYTQPLCACPSRKEPCSASLNTDDLHTTELVTAQSGKVLTLVKTCEPVAEMRVCRAPRDWSLLALQNIRTGKSHYLVICRCPPKGRLEGPMSHDQPAYASVPGIRVYGMMCIRDSYRISRPYRYRRSLKEVRPPLPWEKIKEFQSSVQW